MFAVITPAVQVHVAVKRLIKIALERIGCVVFHLVLLFTFRAITIIAVKTL